MRYISNDGKVFNTEQECCEHEQKIEKNRLRKEQLEMERQNKLDSINKSMRNYRIYFPNMREIMA